MEVNERIKHIFGGILILMMIMYFLLKWNRTTLAMKIALPLMIINVALIAFHRIQDREESERQRKEEKVINISYLIALAILALATYDFSTIWHKLETLEKIGIILIDISVIMMIVTTKSIVDKRKLSKGT
ncbi:MAG: hypothetical protein WC788_08405 [Candidatus Paceibacterota bacterium]|jgi:small-conductance mechanosensitive channel